jgi:arabinoxylan arabinofuranohydrolase
MLRLLFPLLLLTMLTPTTASADGFLFVTFKGEATPLTEQIYFGLSSDGSRWEALNGGAPVLVSKLGEKGVRDPFLLRSHDGKKVYLLATDLSIHLNPDWRRSQQAGSRSLVIWDSNDLVTWSEPRLVRVAAEDAGCTWAPEAVYDKDAGDYLVFWASRNRRDNFAKQRIWASRTKDFKTFSEPFIYIEKPQDVIDTDIVRDAGKYYRFSKDEKFKAITMEVSEKLMGPWRDVPDFSLAKLMGYEGPQCFLLESAVGGKPPTWCLLLDYYSKGRGYQPFVSHDLSRGQFTPVSDFGFPFHFRHGSVLPITAEEYGRLKARFDKSKGRTSGHL